MFLSRNLTPAESNFANIEREAIVWCMERCRIMLIGNHFTLQTDHEPLKYILKPSKTLSKAVSARLQRWAIYIRLSAFDFVVEYVPGVLLNDADALSRLEFEDRVAEEVLHVEYIFESNFETMV